MYRFIFFFMMLLSFAVKAQKDWVRTTDLFGKGCESRYAYGDSVNNLFFADNETRISQINQSFYDLPIDLCHYNIIEVLVFIDSAGNAMDLQILQGSGYDKIDSRIRDNILNFPGLWIPAKSNGKYVSFISRIKFLDPTLLPSHRLAGLAHIRLLVFVKLSISKFSEVFNHCWQKIVFNILHDLEIYSKIIMDDSVSEPTNSAPIYLPFVIFELFGKPVCCLTNYFKISYYRIFGFIIYQKLLKSDVLGIIQNLDPAFNNVLNEQLGRSVRHILSHFGFVKNIGA